MILQEFNGYLSLCGLPGVEHTQSIHLVIAIIRIIHIVNLNVHVFNEENN